jgi:hypothetical protein
MKNDYDAEYEAENLKYGSSGNGGLRWMSMLVMALVVFGFFSLVWYAYNASISEQQQQAVAVIAPEQQEYKVKPEETGGMDIANKDIEAYQLMRRQPSVEEDAEKVERLLPEAEAPVVNAAAVTPVPADPALANEVATIASAESGIIAQPKAELREMLPVGAVVAPAIVASQAMPQAVTTTVAPTPQAVVSAPAPVAQAPVVKETMSAPVVQTQIPASVAKQPVQVVAPPKPRPAVSKPVSIKPVAVKPAQVKAVVAKPVTAKPTSPAKTISGKAYVQLGAVRSSLDAEALWKKLSAAHKDVLGSASHTVEPVEVAGTGTLYRLRARGFASREAALSACSGLKAKGLSCIVSQ